MSLACNNLSLRIDAAEARLAALLQREMRKQRIKDALMRASMYFCCGLFAGFCWYGLVVGTAHLLRMFGVNIQGIQ